jgi:hypothetical protein
MVEIIAFLDGPVRLLFTVTVFSWEEKLRHGGQLAFCLAQLLQIAAYCFCNFVMEMLSVPCFPDAAFIQANPTFEVTFLFSLCFYQSNLSEVDKLFL